MEKETQPPPHPGSTDDAVHLEGGVRGEEAGETDTVVRRDKGVRDEEAGSVFRREGGGRDEEVGATEAAVRRREKGILLLAQLNFASARLLPYTCALLKNELH